MFACAVAGGRDNHDIFTEYAYFSSYSDSWVAHAGRFVAEMVDQLDRARRVLSSKSPATTGTCCSTRCVEGSRCSASSRPRTLQRLLSKGIRTEVEFLGEETGNDIADRYGKADLVVGNNVFAHTPQLLDFVGGLRALVADDGLVSLEFPHLLRLIEGRQYDTIYHEHYSYFTLRTAAAALATADLTVVDVRELNTHGGSLRVLAKPSISAGQPSPAVAKVLGDEAAAGLHTLAGHAGFARQSCMSSAICWRSSSTLPERVCRSLDMALLARATRC